MALHPTLWRTCRVLAGPTRLRLLRRVIARPGLTVQQLADAQDIGKSRASQELRRLQSRGLIQARRKSARVAYHPVPDPLDESNHTDRIDRDGDRWIWCGPCDGFRLDGHAVHDAAMGWTAAEIDESYGPLTFAPRPAGTP